jgi:hypothetical protein
MTLHKAQGLTVDVALVDVTGLADRNSAYVAASRARHGTDLHYTDLDQIVGALADDPFTPRPGRTVDGAARMAQRVTHQRGHRLAIDHMPRWARPPASRGYHHDPYDQSHGRDIGMSR